VYEKAIGTPRGDAQTIGNYVRRPAVVVRHGTRAFQTAQPRIYHRMRRRRMLDNRYQVSCGASHLIDVANQQGDPVVVR
jgi:hypothetical protein